MSYGQLRAEAVRRDVQGQSSGGHAMVAQYIMHGRPLLPPQSVDWMAQLVGPDRRLLQNVGNFRGPPQAEAGYAAQAFGAFRLSESAATRERAARLIQAMWRRP